MKTYIAFLRGINVSGKKKILMPDLKACFEEMNCREVRTYIQSGNVIFRYEDMEIAELEKKLKQQILNEFGFDVKTIVRIPSELESIIKNNPFVKDQDKEITSMYITILSASPSSDDVKELTNINYSPEEFIITDKTIYLYLPNGYGRTKLNNNFFETKLKMEATTRNWKTIITLPELSKS